MLTPPTRATPAPTPASRAPFRLLSVLLRWESILALLLLGTMLLGGRLSPYFWDPFNLGDSTTTFSEKGLIALSMALLILVREIDLSVAAIIALSSLGMGLAAAQGMGAWGLAAVGLLIGVLCGLFNGLLVIRFRVPSIVVTIGTLSLFRGIAQGTLGDGALTQYPPAFAQFGQSYAFTYLPLEFVAFCALALVFGLVLHRTLWGRWLYALGHSLEGARFSGIPVDRLRLTLFALSGLMSGLAAVFLTSRISSTRPNIALGWELDVVTMVILGGVAIAGGSGSILGVFLSVITLGMALFAMSLLNIPGIVTTVLVGALLIVVLAIPRVVAKMTRRG